MEKLIELKTDENIVLSSKVLNIKNPEYIYIPILPNSKLHIKKAMNVQIGTPIISSKDFITSPISGTVTNIKKIKTLNGEIDAIEIKNDYKESTIKETKIKKNLLNIKKEILDKALSLFQIDLTNQKNLVLNCLDDEPYVLTESFYLFLEYIDFLEVLDKLAVIYNLNISIAVKSSNNFSINELMNYLGMYPSIKLDIIPNLYLLGHSSFLLNHLGLNIKESKVIKASEFYHFCNFLKKGRLKSDKLLTISGNNIENPQIIRVKIGTPLSYILKPFKMLKENSIYIANGLMSGKIIDPENFIITEDLTSIHIMKQETNTPLKEGKCLNCGACINICPVNLNPLLFQDEKYYQTHQDKCLNCGLCSYICPVYINFNNRKGDNNE